MKKFAVLGLAVVLVIAFTVPATAFESVFGGYWRTRAYMQKDFSGDDTKSLDRTLVDTRTRLYYTAIFNENLKFVNKFEMDAAWGGVSTGYGDITADGKDVEVKNSYVDFTLGAINSKIGVQAYKLGRGFLFNADFAGAVITYKAEAFELPIFWIKAYEGSNGDNNGDVDFYGIAPKFSLGDTGAIQPFALWATSDDAEAYNATWPDADLTLEDLDIFYLGFDADMNFDMVSVWLTAMYQFGEVDTLEEGSADVSAWLAAIGAKVDFDTFDLHGQIFYASGDDDLDDDDVEGFVPLRGQDYHWAEIMGGGIFDNAGYSNNQSNNSPGWENITNVIAYNIGANFKVMEDLSLRADLWYAERLESTDDYPADPLGLEVDFGATYKLMDNLNLDVVAAYLFADDATTEGVANDENPYEIGAQLSLSF